MTLPIPVQADGYLYTEAKVKKPDGKTIAATSDQIEGGDHYSAILEWNVGITAALSGPDGTVEGPDLRRLLRAMPFDSAFLLACHGMALLKKDDAISGVYECRDCGRKVRAEKITVDGEELDTTDHLFALDIPTLDDPSAGIALTMSSPVELLRRDTGAVVERVESLVMAWPTIGMCIKALQRFPDKEMMMQYATYADALVSVNGKPRDGAWKSAMGLTIFEKMDFDDLATINTAMKRYSVNVSVERVCVKCKTRWNAPIDINGFFGSGLKDQKPRT